MGGGVDFATLRREFAAVVVAVGAKRPRALGLSGEAGPRVYGGVDLLRAVALGESLDLGGDGVVIGGGNVAYDVARTVLRQEAWDAARTAARLAGTRRVRLVSLETLEEMPADPARHRAGGDAWATADLLLRLLERARLDGARTRQDLEAMQAARRRRVKRRSARAGKRES